MTTLLTTIPFQGFYESVHSMYIDDAIDSNFDDRQGSGDAKTPWELDLNYRKACVEYAKRYAYKFAQELGLKTLAFESLDSPREYNFTTDRIFCTIDLDEVKALRDSIDTETLENAVKEKFTSRDGFMSFYQNSLTDTGQEKRTWDKPLDEWDCNQVALLIELKAEEELDNDDELYMVEGFCFDDLPSPAREYADFLYDQQENHGVEFNDLPEFDDWVKQQKPTAAA
jgi:hypothetical protein